MLINYRREYEESHVWHVHLELHRGLERVEVGGGADLFLQGLQENFLEVQHFWKAAKKTFHLGERKPSTIKQNFQYFN